GGVSPLLQASTGGSRPPLAWDLQEQGDSPMTRLLVGGGVLAACGLLLSSAATVPGGEKKTAGKDGWVQLFNGKDLTGWKTHPKTPGEWSVQDGAIMGRGNNNSHLFSDRGDYENFHFRIEAKISDKGNSGQFFRANFEPGFPKGYEAQINSTHS